MSVSCEDEGVGVLQSAWRLLERATRPFGHRFFDIVGGLAFIGLGGVAVTWSGPLAAGTVLLAVVAGLMTKAAFDFQREHDARETPRFHVDVLPVERQAGVMPWVPPELDHPGLPPLVAHDVATVAVEVLNEGPHGHFTAQVEEVRGVRRFSEEEPRDDYSVSPAAWVDTIESVHQIFRGGRAQLKIAVCCTLERQVGANVGPQTSTVLESLGISPGRRFPLMWFWAARSATYSPTSYQMGWRLQPVDHEVRFKVQVVNVDADAAVAEVFCLTFDDAGRLLKLERRP